MINVQVTKIPLAAIILKDDWHGIVYLIITQEMSEEEHNKQVELSIKEIENEFDKNNHYTVSLRETKRQLVYKSRLMDEFGTLVSFRVRDSY